MPEYKETTKLCGYRHKVEELENEFRVHYQNKVEEKFIAGNAREAWQGLDTMMGKRQRPALIEWPDPTSFAEQLNIFNSRFNSLQPLDNWSPSMPRRSQWR